MTTTTEDIRDSVERLLISIIPTGEAKGRGRYRKAAAGIEWENRAEADLDREFSVGLIEEASPTMFGALSEIDYEGSFDLTIGHSKGTNKESMLDRRNLDLCQIREVIEKKQNFPDGVSLIRLASMSTVEREKSWLSVMRFSILYSRAAP